VPENRELRAQRQRAGLSRHSAAAFPAGVIDLLAVIVARLDADKIIAENPLFAFGSESGLCARLSHRPSAYRKMPINY